MRFRIRYQIQGSHVWCRLYVASGRRTGAYSGRFVLRPEEFDALKTVFRFAEFIEDNQAARAQNSPLD